MSSLAKAYARDLHKHFQTLYATWTPGTPLELGDYGKLEGGKIFGREGNISSDFGITFDTRLDDTTGDYDYKSAKSVTVTSHAKGSIPEITTKAAIEIGFTDENAIFFYASKCAFNSIESKILVAKKVKEKLKDNKLRGRYFVVTDLVTATSSNIIISKSKSASILLEAKSDALHSIDLADASVDMSVKSQSNIGLKIISSGGLTPLIGLEKAT